MEHFSRSVHRARDQDTIWGSTRGIRSEQKISPLISPTNSERMGDEERERKRERKDRGTKKPAEKRTITMEA